MLYKLENYDKNEAPLVVYRVYGDGSEYDKLDPQTKINIDNFVTLLSELKSNVWLIANNENTFVRKVQETLNKSKQNNFSFFYLIESKEVLYFTCIFTLFFYFCNAFIHIEQKKYRKCFFKTCFQV